MHTGGSASWRAALHSRPAFWAIMCLLLAAAFTLLVPLVAASFEKQPLGDFTVTFYTAARYLLRGENVYFNYYPNPLNGREYPPFNPVWILYAAVPLSVFPLHYGEAMRLLLDVVGLVFLGYLSRRWAKLGSAAYVVLLVVAPWHSNMVFYGNWDVLVFVGTLLCYWGARRASASLLAIGLWLLLIKPHMVALVIVAALLFAWRSGTLFKVVGILMSLTVLSTLFYPTWLPDLKDAYVNRLAHPRLADSVLLLPDYPWSQLVLLAAGIVFLAVYLRRSRDPQPTPWLWAVLICVSLIGALHTFLYDWVMLMLPLALLLRNRWGLGLVVALYVYPVLWAICAFALEVKVPAPTLIPSVVLIALFASRIRLSNLAPVALVRNRLSWLAPGRQTG